MVPLHYTVLFWWCEIYSPHRLRDRLKEIVALESSVDKVGAKQLDSIFDDHLVSIWRTLRSDQRGGL